MVNVASAARAFGSNFRPVLVAVVLLTCCVPVFAQCPVGSGVTKTWLGTSSDWSTGTNWSPAGAPGTDDLADIPAGTAFDPVLSASVSVCGVQLATGATLSVATGAALTVSGILNCSGTAQITGLGELRTSGAVVATLGANALDLAVVVQSGSVTFAATTISGRLTLSGGVATTSGAVILNGAAPSLAFNGGTLSVGGTTTATNGAESAGTSALEGAGTLAASLSVTGGTLTVSAAGTPTIITGAIDVQAATLLVGAGATLTASNASPALSVQNGGALIVVGVLNAAGTVEATGAASFGGSGTIAGDLVVLSGVAAVLGDLTPGNASDLTVEDLDVQDGAGLSLGVNAMLHATGAVGATFTGTTTLGGSGTLDGDATTVASVNTDTLSVSGSVAVTGSLTVAAGTTLDLVNSLFVAGDVTVAATGVLDGTGALTLDGTSAVALDVSGACDVPLTLAKTSNVDVTLTATATVLDEQLILNGGRLVVDAMKTLTINQSNPAMLVTRGELAVDGDILVGSPAGGVQASGTAVFSGNGAIDPVLTVAGGSASTEAGSALDFAAAFVNAGATFTLDGGATFSGALTVNGDLNAAASSTFSGAVVVSNTGTLTVSNGVTVNATAATPSITVAGGGAGGQVVVDVGGVLVATNDARATGGGEYAIAGSLDVGAGVLDLNASLLSGAGTVLGAGGVEGSAGASTVSFTGSVVGVLEATGGTLTVSGTPTAGSVAVQTAGTLTVNGTLDTAGDVDVNGSGDLNGTGTLTMSPNATTADLTVSGGGSCDVDLVFAATGGGSVVLANMGMTTTLGGDVTVLGGTFQVPNGKTLAVSGLFAIDGATLDLDGSLTSAGGAESSNGAVLDGTTGSFGPMLTASSGTSTLAAAATLTFGSGVAVAVGAVLVLDGTAVFSSAMIDGTLQVTGAGSSISGTTSVSGLLDIDESFTAGGTLTVSAGGVVNVAATKTLTANGNPGVSLSGGDLVLDGTLTAANGLRGSNGAQLSGGGTFAGAINAASPGVFTFASGATATLGGALDIDSGATFDLDAAATFSSLTADGALQVDVAGASVVGAANLSSTGLLDVNETFTVGGLLTVTGGAVDVAATKTLVASAAGVAATGGATLTVAGDLDIGAFLLALSASNLVLPGSGAIPGAAGVTFNGACSLAGPGSIAGPMIVQTGTTTASGGAVPQQGFTVDSGATLTLASGLATPGDVSVDGTVNGAGTLTMNPSTANSNLDVTGTYNGNLQISATGGFAVALGAAPTTTIGGDVTVTGGMLDLGAGKTLAVGDQFFLQGAALVLSGGTLTAVNGAVTSGASTLDGAAGILSAALSIGSGQTTLLGGSSLTFSRGLSVLAGATFVVDAAANFSTASVDGSLDLNFGPVFSGAVTVGTTGTIDVAAGQTLTANGTPGVSVTGGDLVIDGVLTAPNGVVLANGAAISGAGSYTGSIQASAPGTSSVQAASTLTLGGAVTVDAAATFDVAASATFASAIVSGVLRVSATPFSITGTLQATGSGATFDVDQDATVSGLLTLSSGGAVDVAVGATLTAAAMPAVSSIGGSVRANGTLVAAGGVDCSGASGLDGSGIVTAPLTVSAGTTNVLPGADLDLTGALTVASMAVLDAQGALFVAGAATVDGSVTTAAGGLLEVAGPNLLTFNNLSSFVSSGTLRAAAGLIVDTAVSASGTGSVDAPVVLNGGATLTISAVPTLSFTGGVQVPATAALLVTGNATFAGAVALDGGLLDVDGTLGASAISGTLAATIDGTGTINAPLAYAGPGTATILASAVLTLSAGGTITGGTLTVAGSADFGGSTLVISSSTLDVVGPGGSLQASVLQTTGIPTALSGTGSITADLNVATGTTTTTALNALTLAGDLTVVSGAVLTLGSDLDVQGGVDAAGTIDGTGALTLASTAPASFSATGAVSVSVIVDAGAFVVTTAAGSSAVAGLIDVQSGTFLVAVGSVLTVNGGALLSTGTLQVDGTLSGLALGAAGGALNGSGVIDLPVLVSGTVACGFDGTFFAAAPPPSLFSLTVANGGALTVTASPKVNGPISVLGTLTLSGGAVLRICSDLIVDPLGTLTGAGTLSIDGPAGSPAPVLGGVIGVNVDLTGAGGVSLSPGTSITGSLTIQSGAGPLVIPLGSTITLGGPLALNGGSFQVDGVVNAVAGITITANVTLSGAGAVNGPVVISAGTTNIAPPATFTLGGPVTIAAGAGLQVDAAATLTVPGQVVVNGLLHVLSTGVLNADFSAPSILVDGGTIDIDAGGSAVAADGVQAQGTGPTFVVDGTLTTTAGALTLTVSSTIDGAGQYQMPVLHQTGVATFAATASPTFTQSFDGATGTTIALTAGASPTVSGLFTSSGTLQVPSGATFTASGAAPSATFTDLIVDLDGTFVAQNGASCAGAMSLDGAGQWNGDTTVTGGTTTIQLGSALVFGGAFSVQGGQVDFQDGAAVNGLVTVGPGATLHVATGETLLVSPLAAPAVAVDGGLLDIDGVLDAALGTTSTGVASLDGTSGSVTGAFTTTGGTTTVLAGSTLSFSGSLSVTGGTFDAAATTSFGGQVSVANASFSVATGTVFTANGAAAAFTATDAVVTVAGTLTAPNGTSLLGASTLQGGGSIQSDVASPGATTFATGSTLMINGATTIPGPGVVVVAGALTNTGQVAITGGGLSVAAAASLVAQGGAPSVSVSGAALDVDGTLTPTSGVEFQAVSQLTGSSGVVEGGVQIVGGTTTMPGGSTVTMRDLLVGGAGSAAALNAQPLSQLNVVDGGAALCRVAGLPGVATMTCNGFTADALTVEGAFTKSSGLSLLVSGPTLVAAGGVANVAGAATFAGTEVLGMLTAANGAVFTNTLGVRTGGSVQLNGPTTATAVEVDGSFSTDSILGVSGLFDVRAGGTAFISESSVQSLLVGGQLTLVPGLIATPLLVATAASVSGAGAQLIVPGPGVLDVNGDFAVQNGGTFDGTGGAHTFAGNFTCVPGGNLLFNAFTAFTFDGSSIAVADCPNLPVTRCLKTGGGGLTLHGGTTVNGGLSSIGGDLILDAGGTVVVTGAFTVSVTGTFATIGGTKADVAGHAFIASSVPAVTAAADLDLAAGLSVDGSFRPTAGTVTFDGVASTIALVGPYTGPARFHRVVVAVGTVVAIPSAFVHLRDDLVIDGSVVMGGPGGPLGAPNLDVRGDFTIGALGVFTPNTVNAAFAGDFTCINPLGLPQSASNPATVFAFGPTNDFLANPSDASAPPTNRSTLVRSDAALPSVVLAGRGTAGFVQLAEFAAQSCPGGDVACVTTRALRVNGTFTQTADPGVTTLLHSSAAAPGAPSFSLDVQGSATLAGGGFLCCTAQDFAIFRSGAQWTGATCDSNANVICYGDWAATPAFAPSQGTVELRGNGSLRATDPGTSTTLHFATLSVKADPGFTARREVVGGVRFEAGLTSSASAVIIGAGAELAVEPAAPNFFAALLESVDATFLVQGTLAVGANGRLNLGSSTALTLPAGATLRVRGTASQPRAAIGGVGGVNGWSATIGGTLDAERFLIEDLGSAGFVVQSAATLTSFTDGIFRRSTQLPGNSYLLDLRRPASITPFVVQGMEFGDSGFPSASSNQTTGPLSVRTSLGGAEVRFENWSGTLGGNFQDDDPFEASPAFAAVGGKVQWGAPAATVLANFSAVGGSSRVIASWSVFSETPGTTFVVERSSQPTGPFATTAVVPCTGALSYVCVDDPVLPGSLYYYRLVEQSPGLSPRVLGVASAVPFAASFATAPNVFEVGTGFSYSTPQAAIDAAVLGNVAGAVVRLTAGNYPSFVVSATPPGGIRILADGPVVIDTVNGPVLLTGLQADDRVVLYGLAIGSSASVHPAVVVQSSAAPVVISACTLIGGAGQPGFSAAASYGLALDDVHCTGSPGVAFASSVGAAFDGTTDALTLTAGSKLRAAGFVASAATADSTSLFDLMSGPAPRLSAEIFAPLGVPAVFTFAAEPNAPWLFAAAFDLAYVGVVGAPIDLPLLIDAATVFYADVRSTDGSGEDGFVLGVPADPILIGVVVSFQGVAYLPSVGRYRCSSPAFVVVAP